MKGKLSVLLMLVLTCFSIAKICQAQDSKKEISLKFTVGYGSMAVGDINAMLEGQENLFSNYVSLIGGTKEGEFKELNRGFEYEGELIINITENFGLGIGAGYILREEQSKASFKQREDDDYFFFGSSHSPAISAIPIKLTAYYFIPIASRLTLYLNGGFGYYFGKIEYPFQVELQLSEGYIYFDSQDEYEIEAKDNALGFHGGLGFEYTVIKNLAIFVEGAARYAKLKDWKGDETIRSEIMIYSDIYNFDEVVDKNSGTLWYYEVPYLFNVAPEPDEYYSVLEIQEEKPIYDDIRNVRKAEGDFSGFSLRVGIKIIF